MADLQDHPTNYETPQQDCSRDQLTYKDSRRTSKIGHDLKALLVVYKDAKKEFSALPPKSDALIGAARFLRDTTENIIHHRLSYQRQNQSNCVIPHDEVIHSSLLDELLATATWTRELVQRASGKKRTWEQPEEQEESRHVSLRMKKIRRGHGKCNANRHSSRRIVTDECVNSSMRYLPDYYRPKYRE